MPTARELLEQADALMRRNRAAATDDIPVLTDSVAVIPEYQKVARPPAPSPRAPAARRAPDPIPTLTEMVSSDLADESDSLAQEGEPSDWLDLDTGEPSITGEAPDSIAIVPHVEAAARDDETRAESAEPEEIELTTPAEDTFEEEPASPLADVEPVQETVEQAVAESAVPPPVAQPTVDIVEAPEPAAAAPKEPEPVPEFPPAFGQEIVATPEAIAPPPVEEPEAASTAVAAEAAPQFEALGRVTIEPATDMPPMPTVPPLPAPPAPIDEMARWEAMAEEIRMQVLQRIDLFTDTGLREQLGRRLQPIVDRASADLVATINQHVGELLRAYVAEAIEREIESWRKNN